MRSKYYSNFHQFVTHLFRNNSLTSKSHCLYRIASLSSKMSRKNITLVSIAKYVNMQLFSLIDVWCNLAPG